MRKIIKHIESVEHFGKISDLASQMNMEIYIVGGYVRDLLMDLDRDEIDLLVIGDGPKFAKKLAKMFDVKNVTTYKNFGTAHFIYNGINFEFVGARKESYKKQSRNPDVQVGTFEEDISRRDFTINSLAVSLNKNSFGQLIDIFKGMKDLKAKLIRTPLDPLKTFDDDPLRIMRAFRFAAQLKFKIDETILIAASKLAGRLKIVSQERITEEFIKILDSKKPSLGLEPLFMTGVMDIIFPEISDLSGVEQRQDHHHKDVFLHTCKVIDNIAVISDNIWLKFAGLVHDIAKPITKKFIEGTGWTFHGHDEIGARMLKKIFVRMKLPLSKLEYVEKLVRLHLRPIALVDDEVTDSAVRRLGAEAGEDLEDLITLCRADITSKNPNKVSRYLRNYDKVMQKVKDVQEKDKLKAFQSPVDGNIIMKVCNIPPSKKVGEIKSAIEEAILDGKIGNNFEEAYAYLLEKKKSFLAP